MRHENLKHIAKIGNKYSRLLIIGFEKTNKSGRTRSVFKCRCDCGNIIFVQPTHLYNLNTQSCGCLRKDVMAVTATKHGYANKKKFHKGYRSWTAMLARCNNKNSHKYKDYGARGILVCEQWKDFEVFIKDMGDRPSLKHSIDRIDNNGNYEPSNCRWGTILQQARNRRKKKSPDVSTI